MTSCPFCSQPVPAPVVNCPHCGQHAGFPNVRAADDPAEVAVLDSRAASAKQRADKRGSIAILDDLLKQVELAHVVLSRPLAEVTRLASADSEIYSTFYQRTEAGMQIPADPRWDDLRAAADALLFGELNKREIRFGALSLDGLGLPRYGECYISLRTSMIAHRTSLFEENSAVFMQRHGYRLIAGYRASWARRGTLVAAKLADDILPTTSPAEFSKLLLTAGATAADDRFIEVHIYGFLTVRSMHKVKIIKWGLRPRRVEIRALEEKLAKYSVAFEKP